MSIPSVSLDTLPVPAATAPVHRSLSLRMLVFLGFAFPLAMLALVGAIAAGAIDGPARRLVLGLCATGLVVGVAMALWIARRVTAPLQEALQAARRVSAGDLTGTIEVRRADEIGELMRALEEMQSRLFRVVSQVRTGTTTVAATSSQISRDNEALSGRTEGQTTALQETASAMEQLTAAVRQNADNAQQANALVVAASERAARGGELMGEVVQTMGSIRDSSRRIVDIIAAVDGIAFQTNILALNAAVEAARAGAEGRGFAVVASEVRTLAQRCAEAAKEIRGLIGDSVEKVDAGGRLVDDAGRTMEEIVSSVQRVADLMADINAATREQRQGIESVNESVGRVDHMARSNAQLVEGTARTATTLNEQAVALMKSVAGFELGEREHGTAEEAVAMVKGGVEFCRAHGTAALVEDVNRLGKGHFVDRDLYLMVVRAEDAVFVAHGNNPRVLGLGPRSKDVDGRLFVTEMVRSAAARGSGWIEYKWAHPVTNQVQAKASYYERVGDVVVACGIYKDKA